jgi:chorismate synthase
VSGNSIGKLFVVTSFGESHGVAIGAVVDGCPPGFELSVADLQPDLDRRKPGQSKFTTQRKEPDEVEILSGVFEGKTTGTPIGLLIRNQDQRSRDYGNIQHQFRPGHADFTYQAKYGVRDYRGGGRSSARETAMRVAAGAIAKKYLNQQYGMKIRAYLDQMGSLKIPFKSWGDVEDNAFFCADKTAIPQLEAEIQRLRKAGNSVGAGLTVEATNMPIGLGEPIFDRLDAEIAHALMSINAAKGVEIGAGFDCVEQRGTEHRDEMHMDGEKVVFDSNNAGGILGGISSGQNLLARVAFKPTSSITTPGNSVNTAGEAVEVVTKGRHDPCVGIRAVPIVEAMVAITIVDHVLRQRGQNG